jgi:TetR/AcrR family transcriptional repressor for divergent bdcA
MEEQVLTTTRRPRRPAFDREKGVEIAQALFHSRGYDAVSVADLTQALDINTPSLYAAYGSKLALFERVLQRYKGLDSLKAATYLRPGRPPAEALTEMLIAAARIYTSEPNRLGCLVTEATQADDPQAREIAATLAKGCTDVIRDYVAEHANPTETQRITDYVLMIVRGLSSYACLKNSEEQLVNCARTAGRTLEAEFGTVTS